MAGDPLTRSLTRFVSAVTAIGLAAVIAHSAFAAPGRQDDLVVAQIRQQVSQVRGLDVKAETPVVPMAR